MTNTLHRVASELEVVGYSKVTFGQLGIPADPNLVAELEAHVNQSQGSQRALDVVSHIVKNDMTIVQQERCMELGRSLIKPVVESLFADSEEAGAKWSLFGLNRYDKGGKFGPHRDEVGASVLVVTATGQRVFDVYKTEAGYRQEDLTEVEARFTLEPWSVLMLDAIKDPGHAVADTLDASIVAVADVPFVLRPNNDGTIRIEPSPPAPPLD